MSKLNNHIHILKFCQELSFQVHGQKQRLEQQKVLLTFTEKMRQVMSLDECWQIYQKEMEGYGFSEIVYGVRVCDNKSFFFHDKGLLISTYNHEFMQELIKPSFYENDFSSLWCQSTDLVLSWNALPSKLLYESMWAEQIKCMELAWDFNIVNGLTIPLEIENTLSQGGMGLSATGINDLEFKKMYFEYGELIYKLTFLFHQKVKQLPFILEQKGEYDRVPNLTEQEKYVLILTACGHQISEVADKMNKSKKTAENHLSNARTKLEAKTTAQAVSKALLLGYLN